MAVSSYTRDICVIREAVHSDIPKLIEIGKFFVKDIPFESEINEEDLSKTLAMMIDGERSCLFVDENVTATISGLVFPHYFNHSVLMGQELFWWVDPDARNSRLGVQLFNRFEEWVRSMGGKLFSMICMEGEYADPLASFYQRKGFIPSERHFVKVF